MALAGFRVLMALLAVGLAMNVPVSDAATTGTSDVTLETTGTPEAALPDALPEFDTLWDYEHPDSTETRFREIEPAARASGDAPYLAELLTQIARAQGLQRRFDAAHRTLDEVESMLRPPARPFDGDPLATARARYLLERGRVFNSAGDAETARPLFDEALDVARAAGADYHAIDAVHMLAIVASAEEALDWNEQAIAMAEQTSDPRAAGWLGSLYNNTGWTYHDMGEYEKAIALFEKAVDFRREQGDVNSLRIARWCVARTLRSLDRTEEALRRQRELDAELTAAGESDGYVSEEIAECLLALGHGEEATPWFARAYTALSSDPWMAANEESRLARLADLGGTPLPQDDDAPGDEMPHNDDDDDDANTGALSPRDHDGDAEDRD